MNDMLQVVARLKSKPVAEVVRLWGSAPPNSHEFGYGFLLPGEGFRQSMQRRGARVDVRKPPPKGGA
jgi:hypothetical protein